MNQILQMENKKSKGPVEINKIIKFFVIAIIIFACILIGLGSYSILTQKKQNNNVIQENIKPNVDITRDNNDIVVTITHNVAIAKAVYNWNDETATTINGDNRTLITERISLPFGTNTFYITVTDINGEETTYSKDYIVDGDGKPVIELKLTKDNKIKITAQDSSNMKYILYAWNNDEETKVDASADSLNKIEKEIEIPAGQNTLKVQAVNESNYSATKELEVKGVKKPVVKLTKQDNYLVIRAEDEVGMKLVNYTLNGQRYQINYGNKKVIEYKQAIPQGESYIELTAENQDGGTTTVKAKILN